jgi:hypothetical protein
MGQCLYSVAAGTEVFPCGPLPLPLVVYRATRAGNIVALRSSDDLPPGSASPNIFASPLRSYLRIPVATGVRIVGSIAFLHFALRGNGQANSLPGLRSLRTTPSSDTRTLGGGASGGERRRSVFETSILGISMADHNLHFWQQMRPSDHARVRRRRLTAIGSDLSFEDREVSGTLLMGSTGKAAALRMSNNTGAKTARRFGFIAGCHDVGR